MEQLPFYRPAVIYLVAAWALTYFAPSFPAAIADVSIITTAFTVGVVGAFAWRQSPGIRGALCVAAFCLLPPIRSAAQLQTPDALTTLFVVCAATLYISEQKIGAAVLLLLGVGVRSDVMVFATILGALTLSDFLRQRDRSSAIASATMFGAIPASFAVGAFTGGYGYLTLIKFSFFDLTPNIATVASSQISLMGFVNVVITAITAPLAVLMISTTLMGAILIASRLKSDTVSTVAERTLFAATVFYLIAHVLLFPSVEIRFFAPICGALAIVLVSSIGRGQAFRAAAAGAPDPD